MLFFWIHDVCKNKKDHYKNDKRSTIKRVSILQNKMLLLKKRHQEPEYSSLQGCRHSEQNLFRTIAHLNKASFLFNQKNQCHKFLRFWLPRSEICGGHFVSTLEKIQIRPQSWYASNTVNPTDQNCILYRKNIKAKKITYFLPS